MKTLLRMRRSCIFTKSLKIFTGSIVSNFFFKDNVKHICLYKRKDGIFKFPQIREDIYDFHLNGEQKRS